ncbi:MAG: DMT family transporter [Candidatus Heimdallarchaeaceae archaeon]|jgi:uncharacterized membrane protein
MSKLLFALSVLSGLASFAAYNLGFALEKKAIQRIPEEKKEKTSLLLKTIFTNPLWLFGFSLTLLSVGFYFIALLWAPLSAIAPLAGFGLVILVIYAHVDLKESLKKSEIFSFFLILIGITISSYLISRENITYAWEEWKLSSHSIWGIFLMCGIALLIAFFIVIPLVMKRFSIAYNIAIIAGLAAGIQTILMKGVTVWYSNKNWSQDSLILSLYLIALAITGIISTGSLQFGFKKGRVSIIMAIYNGFTTLLPILFGGIILKEWASMQVWSKIVLICAITSILIGVLLLSSNHLQLFQDIKRKEASSISEID